jgi:glyoxylase-like metal-dependent hydrolase (beta-lactamase superfamily II)
MMKTTAITSNSFQLTRLGLANCYLVHESDGFTLLDTGLPGSADDILTAARAIGATIRRILLTHAHLDHVGSVDALAAKLGTEDSPWEFACSARSLPLLQKPPNKALASGEPAGKIKGSVPGIETRPNRFVAEGERYGSLRCIATPGHIPGHLSFLDERDGTLFAGDALVGVGRLTVTGFAPWFFSFPNMATWSKTTAIASAEKLLDLPIERFACGHGTIRSGGISALRAAIAEANP